MSRTRAVLAASSLLPALLFAGCSEDDPEPKFGPTPSATASSPTTLSPSSSAPVAPLDPDQTVKAWVDARNEALHNGDLSKVRNLTAPSCNSCDGILDPIARVYDSGGSFDTTGWQIVASRTKSQTVKRAVVPAALEFAAGTTVPEAGADPVVYKAEKHILNFELAQTNGIWLVNMVEFL